MSQLDNKNVLFDVKHGVKDDTYILNHVSSNDSKWYIINMQNPQFCTNVISLSLFII